MVTICCGRSPATSLTWRWSTSACPQPGPTRGYEPRTASPSSTRTSGVLVLSDYLEPEYATRLLEQGTPGRGYLLKASITDLDRFADAIRRVATGESVVDATIIRRVLGTLRAEDPLAELSEREREILALMAEGKSNHAIAQHFVISERTVESHVGSIFSKLGLANTPDDHRRVLAVLAYLRA